MKLFWPLIVAASLASCGESVSGPSAAVKGTHMAADQYSADEGTYGQPNVQNNPGIAGDWWNLNAPPQPPQAPPAGGYTGPIPQYDPNNPNSPVIGESFGWTDPTTGQQMGGPSGAGGVGGYYSGPNSGSPWWNPPAPGPEQPQDGQTWGGPVAPFSGMAYPTFTPPPLPDYLQKGFQLPSAEELQNSPGYMERFQQGLNARQRSAAAHGTILNGGTQQALTRYGQDYAQNGYNDLVGQKLNERQQQSNDYLNLAYGPAWQSNQAAVNQYGQLYRQYQDQFSNNRSSQNDYWQQQMDLLNAGLKAASSGSPGSTGGQG